MTKGIEMYSTYNEGKYVVTESIIKTLKTKIYKHITTVSKECVCGYADVLDEISDKCNRKY